MSAVRDDELLRAERDLYRHLLDVGMHEKLLPFLDDALARVVEIAGANQGYLELRPPAGGTPQSVAMGCSARDLEDIRTRISSGIVAEALRTGRTISTANALDDPRFKELRSVQAHRIQAVLCAPIGGDAALGAVYLQGRKAAGPFPERDQQLLELFARHIAPLAQRLLRQHNDNAPDATAELRTRLKVEGLAGRSRALSDMLRQMLVAAGVDITALILGESGTGKTEVARALHASSRRAPGPFVELNCAALPEGLFEAELFGAEKGAHSTATKRMPGKIAAAEGGTLFLDEIAEIPLAQQAKLLQFMQSRRYFALGSNVPVEADARVVAATNQDLEQAVADKRFREDLYYRLNVLVVRVPSLRERSEDIPVLADHLVGQAAGMLGRTLTLSSSARAALAFAEWPGNVRQLASAIQRGAAVALSEGVDVVETRHIFPDRPAEEESAQSTYQDALRAFQKRFLQQALDASSGNVSETARRIGLARSHLHELLRAHGLVRARSG